MIILTRRPGETLTFGPGQEVTLTVLSVGNGKVRTRNSGTPFPRPRMLSFISRLIRRLLRRRPRPREGAPTPDGPPHAYEGRCAFCRRDIGTGHAANCPYFEPRLRYGDLLWTGHGLLTQVMRRASGRYNVIDLVLTPRAVRAPLCRN